MNYETGKMTKEETEKFVRWFDACIGTEYECSEERDDLYVVSCFELVPNEISEIRNMENQIQKESIDVS